MTSRYRSDLFGAKVMCSIQVSNFGSGKFNSPFLSKCFKILLFGIFIIPPLPSLADIEDDDGLVLHITFEEEKDQRNIKGGEKVLGKFGSALKIDGLNDYIELKQPSIMEDYSFTVSFWYKSGNGRGWIFSEGNSSSNVPICGLKVSRFIGLMCRSTATK